MVAVSMEFMPFVRELASVHGLRSDFGSKALSDVAANVMARRMTSMERPTVSALKKDVKKRYIIAPRLHQQSAGPTTTDSLKRVHDALKGSDAIIRSEQENGPKVLSLTELEAAVLREKFGGLVVEADIQYRPALSPLLGEINGINVPQSGARKVGVLVRSGDRPVPGARVVLFPRVADNAGYEGVTGPDGHVVFSVRKTDDRFEQIVVEPRAGFWSRVWKGKNASSSIALEVSPLPIRGFDWGLQSTDVKADGAYANGVYLGGGVNVAIIDSGIAPHTSLTIAGGRNYIVGENAADWGNDLTGHGTHCAGVVAAIARQGSVWGYAPAASLFALRIFGGADGGGYASDIGDAIEWAANQGCDIVSMSLAGAQAHSYIRSKIDKAISAGVVCVAAAGNDGGDVSYPARFPNVVGVSAIGKFDAYPKDSLHRKAESSVKSLDGKYYLALFSNRGEEIDVCAPGVAITSTLPTDTYGAWDGTSMACPHVAGVATLAINATPRLREAPRDADRMGMVIDRLNGLCIDLGLGRNNQGSGLPLLSRL